MAWIAKKPCKIMRNNEIIIVPPGQAVPEAKDFSNPTRWCVWADVPENPKASNTTKEDKKVEESKVEEKLKEIDTSKYEAMKVRQLRPMVKKIQSITKDDSTDVKTASKSELIAILKSFDLSGLGNVSNSTEDKDVKKDSKVADSSKPEGDK